MIFFYSFLFATSHWINFIRKKIYLVSNKKFVSSIFHIEVIIRYYYKERVINVFANIRKVHG